MSQSLLCSCSCKKLHQLQQHCPFLQTVCTYWLKGLCMKGDTCGFLHEFNAERMPVCRSLLKYGVCKEPDCPYKHSLQDIKVRLCNPILQSLTISLPLVDRNRQLTGLPALNFAGMQHVQAGILCIRTSV